MNFTQKVVVGGVSEVVVGGVSEVVVGGVSEVVVGGVSDPDFALRQNRLRLVTVIGVGDASYNLLFRRSRA
jgi:hypothetical protein